MNRAHFSGCVILCPVLLGLLAPVALHAAEKPLDPAALDFFEKKVRPAFALYCYKCHSTDVAKPKGKLLLDSKAGLLKGGENGAVVVAGEPGRSRLIEAVRYQNVRLQMPPRRRLPDDVVADLTTWVKMGAPWPAEDTSVAIAPARSEFDLARRKREHWAWQPIHAQTPPTVKDAGWPRMPSDQFILARLEAKGLMPAAPADRRTLLRRVYFDLIGLPPKPEEVEAFLKDSSPEAFEKVVDRLLASEHFGERWGRHWLDLVRYAESHGHEFDFVTPNAYQYRDYIIRAFNADVPYNQLVREHLAGDLLERPRLHPTEGFNESILGTGFWFLGEEVHSPVDLRQDEANRFDNRIDVATKAFLGLTVACARCHDHKFDAIPTRDYYALFGFLESSSYRLARFDAMPHNQHVAAELTKLRERARPGLARALAEAARPVAEHLADYLLAAREAILAGAIHEAQRARLEEIAQVHKLDPVLLGQWVAYLLRAVNDERDPLHAWAKLAAEPTAKDPQRLAELLRPLIDNGRKRAADALAVRQALTTVIDYSQAGPRDWMPDDVSFGTGPVRPGEMRVSGDPARPSIRIIDYAAAEKDRVWDGLKPASGAENDPGALGATLRAGRTIRTPSFTVTAGKVFYLVKGAGQAYAAVNQHALIAGPLHAQLIAGLPASEHFHWVGHDLTPYQGQRVHIEFTPSPGSDFAVALVVQAANAPGPSTRPNPLLQQVLEAEAGSLEALAAGYQRLFLDNLEQVKVDRIVGAADAADRAQLASWLVRRLDLFAPGLAGKRLTDTAAAYLAERAKLTARIKTESRLALAMLDGSGENEHVFVRGSPSAPGEVVPRRFLEALAGPDRLPVAYGSGRLELARQMTDPAIDPFITRVMVNRIWHHLFGRGIVASVDNFGVMGEAPTHPELLDYLAGHFVKDGWSVKKLVRALVLSSTYRMSSKPEARADEADPDNLLLHRMRLRRLEGEAIRDAMLTVSGRLNDRLYGPAVPVFLNEFQQGRGRPANGPLDGDGRRSVYLAVHRNFLSSLLLAFDTPIPFSTVGRRMVSNVPAQALILMNDPFVHQQAEVWARAALAQPGTAQERIHAMYLSAFSRPPTAAEVQACLAFLDQAGKQDVAAWQGLAHVLFNAKEFIFLN